MAPLLDIFVLRLVLGVLIVLRTAAVAPLDGDRLFVNPDPTGINLISTLKILNPTMNNCQQFSQKILLKTKLFQFDDTFLPVALSLATTVLTLLSRLVFAGDDDFVIDSVEPVLAAAFVSGAIDSSSVVSLFSFNKVEVAGSPVSLFESL